MTNWIRTYELDKVWPIGTKFHPVGCKQGVHEVIDILRVFNSKNELVRIEYVVAHRFCGQTVVSSNFVATTIARGNPVLPSP